MYIYTIKRRNNSEAVVAVFLPKHSDNVAQLISDLVNGEILQTIRMEVDGTVVSTINGITVAYLNTREDFLNYFTLAEALAKTNLPHLKDSLDFLYGKQIRSEAIVMLQINPINHHTYQIVVTSNMGKFVDMMDNFRRELRQYSQASLSASIWKDEEFIYSHVLQSNVLENLEVYIDQVARLKRLTDSGVLTNDTSTAWFNTFTLNECRRVLEAAESGKPPTMTLFHN